MLIKALCDYYDVLKEKGKLLPCGYSKVGVSFLVCLDENGTVCDIVDCRTELTNKNNQKYKRPQFMIMPERTEKSATFGNYIDHRPLYIFGLNMKKGSLTDKDDTNKAKKSHEVSVVKNLEFIDGLDSPIINAYRKFLNSWVPENETHNRYLLSLGGDYQKSYYAFCLNGRPEILLHEDPLIKERWEHTYKNSDSDSEVTAQCAITGKTELIQRIHGLIKGVDGAKSSGARLVSFKNPSECSYGNTQSYNCNISCSAAEKYVSALNYLLESDRNKQTLGDLTIVFWASNGDQTADDIFNAQIFGSNSDTLDSEKTENLLCNLAKRAKNGTVTPQAVSDALKADAQVDYYIVGIKPNSSRLSIKFIYRRKLCDIILNIAQHQVDMQMSEPLKSVPMWRIEKELVSPKSSQESVAPALMAKIFESVACGTDYPEFFMSSAVRRVKTDLNKEISSVRAGIIKACLNRYSRKNNQREEIKLALDRNNTNPAYLCGRLFAVLERIQKKAAVTELNRTIKDSYYSSAAATPSLVFPTLIKLGHSHMAKLRRDDPGYAVYADKQLQEILEKMDVEFPDNLSLQDQGRFIIGYYHQLWAKKEEQTEAQ